MTLYAYQCDSCGLHDSTTRSNSVPCPNCGLTSKRKWAFRRGGATFKPHFNYAVGQYVHTDREFREALKRGGDAAGTTYTPHYPGDIPEPTKDTDILETQARTWHDKQAKGEAVVSEGLVIKP